MSDLVLWRHGQTDYNVTGRVQGQVDVPLNAAGLAQARRVAGELAALSPVRVVTSPLARARETAAVLAEALGLEVEVEPGLIERSFGLWEGLTRAEVEAGWPQECQRWLRGEDPRGVGVETRAQTAARVGAALERIVGDPADGRREESAGSQAAARPSGPVVAVAHGAAITLGATHLLGLDAQQWFGLRGLDNCCFARLRRSRRQPGWMLVEWGRDSVAHGGA